MERREGERQTFHILFMFVEVSCVFVAMCPIIFDKRTEDILPPFLLFNHNVFVLI